MEIAAHYLYLFNSNDQWRLFNTTEFDHREEGEGKRTIFRASIKPGTWNIPENAGTRKNKSNFHEKKLIK